MSRDDQRRHQRLVEEMREIPNRTAAKVARAQKGPWYRISAATSIGLITVLVLLYIARPEVEPTDVFVSCPICERGGPFLAPPNTGNANSGATFNVKVQNSGAMGTTLLSNNLTLREVSGGELPKDFGFPETPCANDNLVLPLGSHSTVTLSLPRGEVIVLAMRNPDTVKPNVTVYLYGHIRYRNEFFVPRTQYFCFRYYPPMKGMPEHWGMSPRT
jgi:hypothetical protein